MKKTYLYILIISFIAICTLYIYIQNKSLLYNNFDYKSVALNIQDINWESAQENIIDFGNRTAYTISGSLYDLRKKALFINIIGGKDSITMIEGTNSPNISIFFMLCKRNIFNQEYCDKALLPALTTAPGESNTNASCLIIDPYNSYKNKPNNCFLIMSDRAGQEDFPINFSRPKDDHYRRLLINGGNRQSSSLISIASI